MKKFMVLLLFVPFFAQADVICMEDSVTHQMVNCDFHDYRSDQITDQSSNPGGFSDAEKMLRYQQYNTCASQYCGLNESTGDNQILCDACRPIIDFTVKIPVP